jgi:hypothetical protein
VIYIVLDLAVELSFSETVGGYSVLTRNMLLEDPLASQSFRRNSPFNAKKGKRCGEEIRGLGTSHRCGYGKGVPIRVYGMAESAVEGSLVASLPQR